MLKQNKRSADESVGKPSHEPKKKQFQKSFEKGAKGGKFAAGKNTKFNGKKKPEQPKEQAPTDWRKFKQEKKDLKLKRKQAKDSYEISVEAKQIFEKLKCRRTEEKGKLVEKLFNLLSAGDTIKKLVMAHDTTRVIQCMLKHAAPEMRAQISEKLLPLAVDMCVSKYSHFCVLRMLKYGSPATKTKLVNSLFGNIVRLACHTISSKILDHVYLTVADAKQKAYMRQELYGELYRNAKDDSVKQLADCYKNAANMQASILGSVRSNLEHVSNKQLLDNSLVHAVLLEYLQECEDDKVEDVVTMFAASVPLMLSTKEGCQAAIICFYKSTPKNRRAIIKAVKEHLVKICTHEQGHIFILAVLNALDDTKAIKKAIYDTIHPELTTIMSNRWGRRVIEWLISPADTNCFHPTFIATLEEGLKYSKKDKELRRKEIFEQIEASLTETIALNPNFWVSDKHIGLVTTEMLKRLSADNFVTVANALTAIIADPAWTVSVQEELPKESAAKKTQSVDEIITEANKQKRKKQQQQIKAVIVNASDADSSNDEEEVEKQKLTDTTSNQTSGIEDAGWHIVLKKILKSDKERLAENAAAETFGTILLQQLNTETLNYWLTVNRACFVLINIIENNNEATTKALKTLLQDHRATLKKQNTSGAKLLLKKLDL